MLREVLEQEAYDRGLAIVPTSFVDDIDATIIGKVIFIERSDISYKYNRVLDHELEHADTLCFDLFSAPESTRRYYEAVATARTIRRRVPIDRIIKMYNKHWYHSAEEYAEELEIDTEFWEKALKYYHNYYGYNYRYDKYVINFTPLRVWEVSDR